MNTKTLSIAAAAALCSLIALSYFRSQAPRSGDADDVFSQGAAADDVPDSETLDAERAHERIGATLSQDQRVDAAVDGGAPAAVGENEHQAQVLLPNQIPPTPVTQALEELRLPPVPELLETERQFASESVDPRWAGETEARILGEIAQITGLKLVGLQVECRTTMCRLQLAEPARAAPASPAARFPRQDGSNAAAPFSELVGKAGLKPRWVMSVVDRSGTPVSLAYLER